MPHITGLGWLDWYFISGESRENFERLARIRSAHLPPRMVGKVPIPEERPFEFCPETERTWVSLLFQPDEKLPEFLAAGVGPEGQSFCLSRGPVPQKLLRFRNLLPLTEGSGYEWIEFKPVFQGVRVSIFMKGMILSPEGVMRGIARRLRRDLT